MLIFGLIKEKMRKKEAIAMAEGALKKLLELEGIEECNALRLEMRFTAVSGPLAFITLIM